MRSFHKNYLCFYSVIILFYFFNQKLNAQALDSSFCLKMINGDFIPYQINGGSVSSPTYVPYHDFQKQPERIQIPLSSGWKKQRQLLNATLSIQRRDVTTIAQIEAEGEGRHTAAYNDDAWTTVSVPVSENTMPSYENLNGVEEYEGGVWYRKNFTVDASWEFTKYITLNFLGAGYIADVWLNDEYLGFHEGGDTPFLFDITGNLDYSGENILAVRLHVIPWGSILARNNAVIPFKKVDWFNHWGIHREVFLAIKNKQHIVRSDIRTIDNQGNILIKTIYANTGQSDESLTTVTEIFEADFSGKENTEIPDPDITNGGSVISWNSNFFTESDSVVCITENKKIPDPKYWYPSKENAHLYILKITLKKNDEVIDEYWTQFGLRTLETRCSKILLNGYVSPFLAGVGRHEESPFNGKAMSNAEIFNDIQIARNVLKANLVRSHYPFHPITYKFQDRFGMVAYVELPVYWFNSSVDFDRLNNRRLREQMWREMIYANYNSPSIWFWSTQNESEAWARLTEHNTHLRAEADKIDGSRIIIQSAAGKNVTDPSHAPLDAVGLTMYYGTFHGEDGQYYQGTSWALGEYHANNPDKPLFDTEFGMWSEPDNSNSNHQIWVFNETFRAFTEKATWTSNKQLNPNGYLAGCTWWAAFNWYTSHNTLVQSMGLLHMNRATKKPISNIAANEFRKYSEVTPDDIPYNRTHLIPGKIQAEDYTSVCPGSGYHDLSPGNAGGIYRLDNVDIESCGDAGGGYNVGWIESGEWLEYNIEVKTTEDYIFELRISSPGEGRRLRIEINGVNVSSTIPIPNTGDWRKWESVVTAAIPLTEGFHVMKVFAETGGFNFNYVKIYPASDPLDPEPPFDATGTTAVADKIADRDIKVYPSPVEQGNVFSVEVLSGSTDKIRMDILNSLGQVQFSTTYEAVFGRNVYKINTMGMAKGSYILRLESGSFSAAIRIIII